MFKFSIVHGHVAVSDGDVTFVLCQEDGSNVQIDPTDAGCDADQYSTYIEYFGWTQWIVLESPNKGEWTPEELVISVWSEKLGYQEKARVTSIFALVKELRHYGASPRLV